MNITTDGNSPDNVNIAKFDRSSSKCTDDSGVCTEDETSSVSDLSYDDCEEDYHFVEAIKVLGVHKQETPSVHYVSKIGSIICFIQTHWLFYDVLYVLRSIAYAC